MKICKGVRRCFKPNKNGPPREAIEARIRIGKKEKHKVFTLGKWEEDEAIQLACEWYAKMAVAKLSAQLVLKKKVEELTESFTAHIGKKEK